MNTELKFSMDVFGYWINVTFFELDWDSSWGYCLGLLKLNIIKEGNQHSDDRCLFQVTNNKYLTSFKLLYFNVVQRYK